MNEQDFSQEAWDKGKIIKGLALLLIFISLIFYVFKMHILDKYLKKNQPASQTVSGQVKGAQTANADNPEPDSSPANSFSLPSSENIQSSLEDKVYQIKQEIANLNVGEVASSSAQVQKILKDVKSLEHYPSDQAKNSCLSICNSL